MKSRTRKIVIGDQVYIWGYSDKYLRDEDSFLSRLFFSPEADKNTYTECYFLSHACYYSGCIFNVGFPAFKNGQKIIMNFNQPSFAAEFIKYLLDHKVDFSKHKTYKFEDGWLLLTEMGFDFGESEWRNKT